MSINKILEEERPRILMIILNNFSILTEQSSPSRFISSCCNILFDIIRITVNTLTSRGRHTYIEQSFVYMISLNYLVSANIISSLCIITKTIPTAEVTSNNEKMLLCPSAYKNVLKPNGLAAKNNNTTRTDESIVNSLPKFLLLSCDF